MEVVKLSNMTKYTNQCMILNKENIKGLNEVLDKLVRKQHVQCKLVKNCSFCQFFDKECQIEKFKTKVLDQLEYFLKENTKIRLKKYLGCL